MRLILEIIDGRGLDTLEFEKLYSPFIENLSKSNQILYDKFMDHEDSELSQQDLLELNTILRTTLQSLIENRRDDLDNSNHLSVETSKVEVLGKMITLNYMTDEYDQLILRLQNLIDLFQTAIDHEKNVIIYSFDQISAEARKVLKSVWNQEPPVLKKKLNCEESILNELIKANYLDLKGDEYFVTYKGQRVIQ